MGWTRAVLVCALISVLDVTFSQDPSSSASSTGNSNSRNFTSGNGLNPSQGAKGDSMDQSGNGRPEPVEPVWLKCVSDIADGNVGNDNIKQVLDVWCGNYEKIISCLSRDIEASAPTNPLDFFINLNFDEATMLTKSQSICSKLQETTSKLSCAASVNETLSGECANAFSGGLVHVFSLHKERNPPIDVLRGIACDVTLQTTFCLTNTLPDCEEEAQTVLLNYYALFTNGTCVAQPGQDLRAAPPETVVSKCAREAAQTLTPEQAEEEPTSLMDFLVLGLKTDCKTYPTRYSCYQRELDNITNFRDFWLSLTFDYDNAMASQKAYCDQIDTRVIPKITNECFNQSQPGLAACEAGFGREVEAIRDEWFNNPDFDGLQLQTLACRTSVTRAACLDNAMQPCGTDVARAMAVSEMGILPDICRRLLAPKEEEGTTLSPNLPSVAGNVVDDGNNRADTGSKPSNDGNYEAPSMRPSYPTGNEIPLSDQAPRDNMPTQGHDTGYPEPEPPSYDSKKKSDAMTKPTEPATNTNKKSDSEDMMKEDNSVSASNSQGQQDNGSPHFHADILALMFHVMSLAWFLYG